MPKRKLDEVDSGEDLNSAQSESDDSNCSNVTESSTDISAATGECLVFFVISSFFSHYLEHVS